MSPAVLVMLLQAVAPAAATDLSAGCPSLATYPGAHALYASPPVLPIDYDAVVALVQGQTEGGTCDSTSCVWADGSAWTLTGDASDGTVYVRLVGEEAAWWGYSALDATSFRSSGGGVTERTWSAEWTGTPFVGLEADSQAGESSAEDYVYGYPWHTFERSTIWLGDCGLTLAVDTPDGPWPLTWLAFSDADHLVEIDLGVGACAEGADRVRGTIDGGPEETLSPVDWAPVVEDDADGDGWSPGCGDCDDEDPRRHPDIDDVQEEGPDIDCDGWPLSTDCDEADPTRHPDAPEVPNDGIDQDCDGADFVDLDGDGHDALDDDCDDADATIYTDAPEVPNDGIDQDCNGLDFVDLDGDGHEARGGDDCDDTNPAAYRGATEVPCDLVDEDCDRSDPCGRPPGEGDSGGGAAETGDSGDGAAPAGPSGCATAPGAPGSAWAAALLLAASWRRRSGARSRPC